MITVLWRCVVDCAQTIVVVVEVKKVERAAKQHSFTSLTGAKGASVPSQYAFLSLMGCISNSPRRSRSLLSACSIRHERKVGCICSINVPVQWSSRLDIP